MGWRYGVEDSLPRLSMGNMMVNGHSAPFHGLHSGGRSNRPDVWRYFVREGSVYCSDLICFVYLTEVRERLAKNGTKIKLRIYKPLADEEMAIIHAVITKYRKKGDFYTAVIEKCMTQWTDDFRQVRVEAGPPSDELLTQLVDQLLL